MPEKSGMDPVPATGNVTWPKAGPATAADNANKKSKPRGCKFMIAS
jgi:hypothetical protein